MLSTYENRLSMYLAVRKTLDQYETTWNSNNAFVEGVNLLKQNIAKIEATMTLQAKPTTGVTKTKKELLTNMLDIAFKVSKATVAYAVESGNDILEENVKFSRSKLEMARDTVALESCQLIYDSALPFIAELQDYGIEQVMMDQFQEALQQYEANISAPRNAIITRRNATTTLTNLFKETNGLLLQKLDMLLELYKDVDNNFVTDYFNARKVIETGKFTHIKGVVTHNRTGKPVAKAVVVLTFANADGIESTAGIEGIEGVAQQGIEGVEGIENEKTLTATTNEKGAFLFNKIPAGLVHISIAKEGYELLGIEKPDIRRGKTNDLGELKLHQSKQLPPPSDGIEGIEQG